MNRQRYEARQNVLSGNNVRHDINNVSFKITAKNHILVFVDPNDFCKLSR